MFGEYVDSILERTLEQFPDLSDIIVTAGKHIQAEQHGKLHNVSFAELQTPLRPFQTKQFSHALMEDQQRLHKDLATHGSCDLAYALDSGSRFRVNIFHQKGSLAVVMRKLPTSIPTLQKLNLPPLFTELTQEKYGLILVTGGTGTGKSTTLAALIDGINATRAVHILTLEDPIEFVHQHQMGTINQRELGTDFDVFASGLRAALRQAPKVILVGEMRDKETVEIAMQAAETGHLVLGTLHTSDAGQTVNRIAGLFDPSEEHLIRSRLAESVKCIVAQRLVPTVDGGRAAVHEILRNTLRIREIIANGESAEKTFYQVIEDGKTYGMKTFDQSLLALFEEGRITQDTAMLAGSDKSRLRQMIDRTRTVRGEVTTDITSLEIDDKYDTRHNGE